MGCGGSTAAPAASGPSESPSAAPTSPPPAAEPAAPSGPAVPPGIDSATADEANNKRDEIEQAKQISKEAFAAAMRKLLDLAIDGYPKALRSTLAKRNALLRETQGDQEAAVQKIQQQAAAMSEEGKTWLLGLVPYVGLPAQLLYPTWTLLRRVCLLAATYGLDLSSEDTRGRILQVFAGLRAVPAAEYGIEQCVQMVWVAFAGPVAGMLPIGTLVSKVSNVEGKVVDSLGRDSFKERGRPILESEYSDELDPEPTMKDYASLAKDGTAFALYSTWKAAMNAAVIAQDKDKRADAMGQAVDMGKQAAEVGKAVGGAAVTVGIGAAAVAKDQGTALVGKLAGKVQGAAAGSGSAAPKAAP